MNVKIISQQIFPELSAQSTDFLLGNVMKKLRTETVVEHAVYAIADNDNQIVFNYTNGMIGLNWVYDPRGQFKDFVIGDIVEYKNYITNGFGGTPAYSGVINVIDKLDDFHIQIDVDLYPGNNDQYAAEGIWNVKTPVTAMKYRWNFIENSEAVNYFSKVDGSEQILVAPLVDATDTTTIVPMQFLGAPLQKPYQIGSATIVGMGINTTSVYGFRFKIIHHTFITPFFLAEQWDDLQNGIAPGYFFNQNCLKYISEFTCMFDYADPNRIYSGEQNLLEGNTGWMNEANNTGLTNYFIQSKVFKDNALNILPAIALSVNDTNFTIVIKNTINAPFVNNATKFVVNFVKAPFNESEYQNNTNTLAENFLFDRALQTVGSASVNGDNYGTAYQVLKNISATWNSNSQITITGKITMDASIVAALSLLDEARYILTVEIQDHTLSTLLSDDVLLRVDAQDFFIDNTDPTMIIIDKNTYLRHFESNPNTEGSTSVDAFKEDELTAITTFYVDHNGRTSDTIELEEIEMKIIVKNSSTLEEFTLYTSSVINLSTFPYINGDQFFQLDFPNGFHVPVAEKIKHIKLQRQISLDNANKSYYALQFPFIIDWAYFISMNPSAGDFFNVTQPKNGWNHDWFRMTGFTNWNVYYNIKIKANKNGAPLVYEFIDPFTLFNYANRAVDYQPVSIKAYDNATNTLLYDSVNHIDYIEGFAYTRIEAKFQKVENYPVVLADVVTLLGIEVYEEGGVYGRRRISSKWVMDNDTWFLSSDGSGKIVNSLFTITHANDGLLLVALIDFTKIPLSKPKFKITARVYDLLAPVAADVITEDGNAVFTEDGHSTAIEA